MRVRTVPANSARSATQAKAPTMALADFAGDFDALGVEGQRDAAEQLAAERIAAAPEDAAAHFAIGLAQFLGAVEGLGQGLHRFGLTNTYGNAAEAVLEGRSLLPHRRLAKGRCLNLRRLFETPPVFEPILIAQGTAVLPYLEDGETVSADTLWGILNMREDGPLGYCLRFN